MNDFVTGLSLIHTVEDQDMMPEASSQLGLERRTPSAPELSARRLLLEVKERCRGARSIDGADPLRYPTTLDAQLEVPMPGKQEFVFGHYKGFEIGLVSSVSIKELRVRPSPWINSEPQQKLLTNFIITRKLRTRINVAHGFRILMVSQKPEEHRFFGPGSHNCVLHGRHWTIQVQSDSGNKSCVRISLPHFLPEEQLDLSGYAGYRLFAQRRPLRRVLSSIAKIPIVQKFDLRQNLPVEIPPTIQATFEYCEYPEDGPLPQQSEDKLPSPPFKLPPGRYELEVSRLALEPLSRVQPSIALQLFPSRAVKVEYRGQSIALTPRIDGTYRGLSAGPISHAKELVFHPAANTLVFRSAQDSASQRPHSNASFSPCKTTGTIPTWVIQVRLADRTG